VLGGCYWAVVNTDLSGRARYSCSATIVALMYSPVKSADTGLRREGVSENAASRRITQPSP